MDMYTFVENYRGYDIYLDDEFNFVIVVSTNNVIWLYVKTLDEVKKFIDDYLVSG